MDGTTNFQTGLGTITTDTYNYVNGLLSNPSVVIILVIVVVLYVIIFMSLGTGSVENVDSSSSSGMLSIIFIAFFILLLGINGLQYLFGIDVIAKIKNLLSGTPEIDIQVDTSRVEASKAPVPEILLRPQVFNIPGNTYVYSDAKALCSAYGARLATYQEIEDAYKSGGEWCNYGWSDGQMALFPTQQKTFDELQKIEGHENDCGRPGVNGGYIANPMVRFGVNCYGYKPRMTQQEEDMMANEPIYPKTLKDIAMEHRVNYWKDKLTDIIVSPFNHNSWSRL
jgi:Extracellular link domain